jgi:hypothetical protein
MSPMASPTPTTRMRPHTVSSEQSYGGPPLQLYPKHHLRGSRTATATAVTKTAAAVPSTIFDRVSRPTGRAMALARMIASTAIAAPIHLHSVPVV